MRVGIDLVEVARVEKARRRWGERFLGRVYTDGELAASRGRDTSLAARFAAKEAAAKALGVGIGGVAWREVEVVTAANGKPELVLHGRALALSRELGLTETALSLSDTADHAVAVVILS